MDTYKMVTACLQDSVIDRISRVSGIPLPHGAFIRDRALHLELPPQERSAFHSQINAILPICSQVGLAMIHLDSPGLRRISCPVLYTKTDCNSLDDRTYLAQARRLETLQNTLLPHVQGVLLVCDREGIVVNGNAKRETVGFNQETLLGRHLSTVFPHLAMLVESLLDDAFRHPRTTIQAQLSTQLLNGSPVRWQAQLRSCGESVFCQLTPLTHHPWLS